jgi:lysozyme family protein
MHARLWRLSSFLIFHFTLSGLSTPWTYSALDNLAGGRFYAANPGMLTSHACNDGVNDKTGVAPGFGLRDAVSLA